METHDTPQQDKQITVEVLAERVPEFYAFYARFLAAEQFGRRRRRGGPRGHGRCGGGRHGRHGAQDDTQAEPTGGTPAAPPTGESATA